MHHVSQNHVTETLLMEHLGNARRMENGFTRREGTRISPHPSCMAAGSGMLSLADESRGAVLSPFWVMFPGSQSADSWDQPKGEKRARRLLLVVLVLGGRPGTWPRGP